MRYHGTRAVEVTIEITILPTAYENENFVKSGLLSAIIKHGHIFKVIVPENVRSIEDMKFISFEAITGITYTQEISESFKLNLKNIKYLGEDFIYCLTVAELRDFDINVLSEYVDKNLPKKQESELVSSEEC
jgi:hypothetical protein